MCLSILYTNPNLYYLLPFQLIRPVSFEEQLHFPHLFQLNNSSARSTACRLNPILL